MEIISSQSFLHENFLMARCLPCIILSREKEERGIPGTHGFASAGPGDFVGKTGGKRSDVVQ